MSRIIAVVLILAATGISLFWYNQAGKRVSNLAGTVPAELTEKMVDQDFAVLAANLEIPWSLDFLPDGRILVTERPGRVRLVTPREGLLPEAVLVVEEVLHRGEGGLLGLAVHPEFERTRRVFLYYTYLEGQNPANKVVAYTFTNQVMSDPQTILDRIPGARTHNGGRIKFGPDAKLYITTGDAERPQASQDPASLAGKILRVRDDGSIPEDNPFAGSPVYSYGHRNPQGLAWDEDGRLWATEHGPIGRDEINLIQPGKNYGWPVIRGDEEAAGMVTPVLHSGRETWAPSGADVLGDSMYFAGLRGRTLYQFNLSRDNPVLTAHLTGDFGRLRDVVAGPEGFLYLLTSNRDGRGLAGSDDDLLLVINTRRF
ncbi:PQQ-dependent sugar dehydrogenase [Desulfurivibrio alkaliphilus]|nr:PQQ-dependent sugar dehydrogenase [Desulfurivibrio alkaliphilus]